MNTADEKTDLDLIAAFIDGRLAPVERERTLQLLARDEAAFDIFADAVRVQGSEADTKVIPIDTRRSLGSLKPWTVLVPAAAAAVLLIAVLPRLRPGGGSIAGAPNAAVIVAQLEQQPSGLRMVAGPGWEQRDWSVTRGGTSSLAESARDFRLGVREVDLQVAVAMDARQLADRLVAEMMGWIAAIQFSEPVASRYTDVRARLVLGKWCVGAELAARGRQGAFFQSQLTAGVIKDALEGGRAKLDAEDAATLRQAAALARPGVADEDFDRVRERLRALIKRHGG
jgi:hypothetical protein